MRGLLRAFYVITHMFSITLEVFLRHRFGERYLHSVHVMLSLGLAALYVFQIAPRFGTEVPEAKQLVLPAALFLALSVWHLLTIQFRLRRGEQWHSKSSGDSWLYFDFLPIQQQTFQRFVEPTLCLFFGYLLRDSYPPFAIWIMLASGCMLIKGQIEYQRSREIDLDRLDSEFESGRRNPASQNVVTLASFQPVQGMVGVKEYFGALPTALQNIIAALPEIKYEKVEVKLEGQNQASENKKSDGLINKLSAIFFEPFDRFLLIGRIVFWLPLMTGVFVLSAQKETNNLQSGLIYMLNSFATINISISIMGAILLVISWSKKGELPFKPLNYAGYTEGPEKELDYMLYLIFPIVFVLIIARIENAILRGLLLVFGEVATLISAGLLAKEGTKWNDLPRGLRIVTVNKDAWDDSVDKWLGSRAIRIKKNNITLFLTNKALFAVMLLIVTLRISQEANVVGLVVCCLILLANKLISYFYQANPAGSFWSDVYAFLKYTWWFLLIPVVGVGVIYFTKHNWIKNNFEEIKGHLLSYAGIVIGLFTVMLISQKLRDRAMSNNLKIKRRLLENYWEKHPNDAETQSKLAALLKEVK